MATQSSRLIALAQAVGADVKAVTASIGALSGLSTTEKSNLVAAINELKASITSAGAAIDDSAASSSSVYSSSKTDAQISAAIDALIAGAPGTYDTLKEIADYIAGDASATAALTTAIGNRVQFDVAQVLTPTQQAQACANIGVGDPDTDLVAAYTTAKA